MQQPAKMNRPDFQNYWAEKAADDLTPQQRRLYTVLLASKSAIACHELIDLVGGYSANNLCENTHDTTAREELRKDKHAINIDTDEHIVSSKAGYKIATLYELIRMDAELEHEIFDLRAKQWLIQQKIEKKKARLMTKCKFKQLSPDTAEDWYIYECSNCRDEYEYDDICKESHCPSCGAEITEFTEYETDEGGGYVDE